MQSAPVRRPSARAWTAVTRRRGRPHPDRRELSTDYLLRRPAVLVVRRPRPVPGGAQRGAGTHSPTPAAVAVRDVLGTLTNPDRSTGTRPPRPGLHACGCLQRLLFTDRRTSAQPPFLGAFCRPPAPRPRSLLSLPAVAAAYTGRRR